MKPKNMEENKEGYGGLQSAPSPLRAFALLIVALAAIPGALASIVVDDVSFDPAVIASGDEVDVSINFRETEQNEYSKANDGRYTLRTRLEAADTVAEEYVVILDGKGERNVGHLFPERVWTRSYRVKVLHDAPAGTYQFRMRFEYLKEGEPTGHEEVRYFTMPVKREGIIMNVANIITEPAEVRPGDTYVTLSSTLENSGTKDAKAVEFRLEMPDGFTAPYADDNRVWAGYIAAGEQQALESTFHVDERVEPGLYEFSATLTYMDLDDNAYEERVTFPVRVRPKPVLVVAASNGTLLAGGSGELRVTVRNVGASTAEMAEARVIKQSSQPFDFEVRSDYLGTLEPGEEGVVVFPVKVRGEAPMKEHDFTLVLRAKGDSDEGDDTIYTFSREATVHVDGKGPNWLAIGGAGLLGLIGLALIARWGLRRR